MWPFESDYTFRPTDRLVLRDGEVSDGAAAWNDAAATMADPASLEEFFYLERDHLIRMAVVTGNRQ
jgi:hypothetical protein